MDLKNFVIEYLRPVPTNRDKCDVAEVYGCLQSGKGPIELPEEQLDFFKKLLAHIKADFSFQYSRKCPLMCGELYDKINRSLLNLTLIYSQTPLKM